MIAWGGQDFLNFWEIRISKKIQVFYFFCNFLRNYCMITRRFLGKMNLSIFQELLTPFLTVSLISTKINLFVHWYFQRQFGYCWRQSQKKSIFPRRNHYFGVFHIHYHPMHYNITKKHTLSLHVKNIDIKNYAINSATADVLGGC